MLEITAYSHLVYLGPIPYKKDGKRVDYAQVPGFQKQGTLWIATDAAPVLIQEDDFSYLDHWSPGFYQKTPNTLTHSWKAGSSSSYHEWRQTVCFLNYRLPYDTLLALLDEEEVWMGGLLKLLFFSDCEGTIGPVTSAEIARDMRARESILQSPPLDLDLSSSQSGVTVDSIKLFYHDLLRAFEMASEGGVVEFR